MFKKIYLVAVVASVILFNTPLTVAYAPTLDKQIEQVPTPTEVEQYIRQTARELRIDEYTFVEVAQCESGFLTDAIGDNGLAFGVFQFHKTTWNMFNEEFEVNLDYFSWKDQVKMDSLAWKRGYEQRHWTCWKKLFNLRV